MEWFGTAFWEFASIFVPQNGIPRVCFYFCSTEWNSELFSLPWKGSVKNSESLLLFLFHGPEIREITVLRNSRKSVGNDHLCRQFRLPRNYFFFGNCQPYVHTVSHISAAVGVLADASAIVGGHTTASIPAIAGVPLAELACGQPIVFCESDIRLWASPVQFRSAPAVG